MTSHYTWGSVTTPQDIGNMLGRPLHTFFWALTISWSWLLAHVGSGPNLVTWLEVLEKFIRHAKCRWNCHDTPLQEDIMIVQSPCGRRRMTHHSKVKLHICVFYWCRNCFIRASINRENQPTDQPTASYRWPGWIWETTVAGWSQWNGRTSSWLQINRLS